jgi:uncharacterized Tic20 family protein
MQDNHQKNIATYIHLSTFTRFIIPFGNIIGPTILWTMNKHRCKFIDEHGKQAINFQITNGLYTLGIAALWIPLFFIEFLNKIDLYDFNSFYNFPLNGFGFSPLVVFGGVLSLFGILDFIFEIVFILKASKKAKKGESYDYPITYNFIK